MRDWASLNSTNKSILKNMVAGAGVQARNTSEECRARVEDKLEKSEKGKELQGPSR